LKSKYPNLIFASEDTSKIHTYSQITALKLNHTENEIDEYSFIKLAKEIEISQVLCN